MRRIILLIFALLVFLIVTPLLFLVFQYISQANFTKANIYINTAKVIGPIPDRWKAFAQGGEEKGVAMLANVIPQIAALRPKYIRIDHIYDYYDVVGKNPQGKLVFDWSKLDQTVCDIYHTGAKPFFSLSYMPSNLSVDGTPISEPREWEDWALIVQRTIERYSGVSTRLCGQVTDFWLTDIYYEVWNEPNIEPFGKWTVGVGERDYSKLYLYSTIGAFRSKNVKHFFLGGPALAYLEKKWFLKFLQFVSTNNLRLDFLSWHHYSSNPEDFTSDVTKINSWLSGETYTRFLYLPRMITEWGFDDKINPVAHSEIGAAHTIASIRNFLNLRIDSAFLFEIKDGQSPSWGILTYEGKEKPRYNALKFLNLLEGRQIFVEGEGSKVKAIAAVSDTGKVIAALVNYDPNNNYTESVPVTFDNLTSGQYALNITYLDGKTISVSPIPVLGKQLQRIVILPPNSVAALELERM